MASTKQTVISAHQKDLLNLLKDISEIPKLGAPGVLTVFGPNAFPFIVGKHKGCFHPLAAAGRLGKGRVIIYSHDGYPHHSKDSKSLNQLIINNIHWCTGKVNASTISIGIHNAINNEMMSFLRKEGFAAVRITDNDLLNVEKLSQFCVTIIQNVGLLDQRQAEIIKTCLKQGGGLILGNTAWAWDYYGPSGDIRCDHPGNLITHEAGLGWTISGYLEGTSIKSGFSTDLNLLENSHALDAWDSLRNAVNDKIKSTTLFSILEEALMSIPYKDTLLLPRISQQFQLLNVPMPTKEYPVTEPLEKLILTLMSTAPHCASLPIKEKRNIFPGQVDDNVPRVQNQLVVLEITYDGMYSTGLYAGPGDEVKVEFVSPVTKKGLQIQIGCHSDNISRHEKWSRFPQIVSKKKVNPGQNVIVTQNRFGGLVYLSAHQCDGSFGTARVKISGCILAPHFVLGKTNVQDWRLDIRNRRAPWGELANSKIIFTFPSESIREVMDPEPVLIFWEKIIDSNGDLVGRCKERPERMVADVQISCGYMHSGYPIMIHADKAVEAALNIKHLQTPASSWGHYHEIGHNYQEDSWTFEGAVEVTCNLFTLYVLTTVCGCSFQEARDIFDPKNIKSTILKYCKGGKDFNAWKSDPFLALLFYYQLQQEFGWGAFKKVFSSYRNLNAKETPTTDQDKLDLWLVMFSRTVKQNLNNFFVSWGMPVSQNTKVLINHLPHSELNIGSLLI